MKKKKLYTFGKRQTNTRLKRQTLDPKQEKMKEAQARKHYNGTSGN